MWQSSSPFHTQWVTAQLKCKKHSEWSILLRLRQGKAILDFKRLETETTQHKQVFFFDEKEI